MVNITALYYQGKSAVDVRDDAPYCEHWIEHLIQRHHYVTEKNSNTCISTVIPETIMNHLHTKYWKII